MDFAKRILGAIFTRPLRFIYKNGPSVFLLWEGVSDESICYEITSVESSFWKTNDETLSACSEIIERKSNAFIIAVYLLIGAYCIYTLVSLLIYKYFFMSHLSAILVDRIEGVHITMRTPGSQVDEPHKEPQGKYFEVEK